MDIAVGELKQKLTKYARSLGVSEIGFANIAPLTEAVNYLKRRELRGYRFHTNAGAIDKKIDPLVHLPEAKSVIVIAVAYGNGLDMADGKAKVEGKLNNGSAPEVRGPFSKVSWGRDYHYVLMEILKDLADFIRKAMPEAKTLPMVDTGHLLEKSLAVRAGLGWIGNNSLLVTPNFGSFVFLGLLLTDVRFPPDQPVENRCGSCQNCREACPVTALEEDNLNLDRCLGNLCLYSDPIEEDLREKFSYLYGCDLCQEACPYNVRRNSSVERTHPQFEAKHDEYNPVLKNFLQLSNKEFKTRYGHLSAAWRGKRPILRNAILLAGKLRDENSVEALEKIILTNPHPDIRLVAKWAIDRIKQRECTEPVNMEKL